MDVKCKNCGTEYTLDETLVSAKGTSVRCTKCSSVFKVYSTSGAGGQGDQWILRKGDGTTTSFGRMYILQRWIGEGKATTADFLSRDGEEWKRLGDIPELKSFFAAAKTRTPSDKKAPGETGPQKPRRQTMKAATATSSRIEGQPSAAPPKRVPMAKAVESARISSAPSVPKSPPVPVKSGPDTLPPPPNPQASQPKIAVSSKGSLFASAKPRAGREPSLKDWQAGVFDRGGRAAKPTASAAPVKAAAGLPVSEWEPDLKENTPATPSQRRPFEGDSLLEPPAVEQSVAFSLQNLAASLAPGNPVPQVAVPDSRQVVPGARVFGGGPPSQPPVSVTHTTDDQSFADQTTREAPKISEAPTPVPQAPAQQTAPAGQTVPHVGDRSGLDFSQIPASHEDRDWNEGSGMEEVADPAWTDKSGTLPRYHEEDDALAHPKRRWGSVIAALVILGLLLGGVYIVIFKWETIDSIYSNLISSKEIGRYKKFYDRGRENFLLDSDSYFQQADREYQKVLALEEDHPQTLAALGEMYAVWAQYLRDAKADAISDARGLENSSEVMNREIERLNSQYEQKLAEAVRWTEQALAAEDVPAEVYRVSSDIKRLQGDLEGATKALHKARAMGADPETEYVALLLDLENGKSPVEVEQALGRIIEAKPLIRAMYRRARLLANQGKLEEAKAVLGKIFQLNSDHSRAQELAARIDNGKPIPLTEAAPPEEEEAAKTPTTQKKAEVAGSEAASPAAPLAAGQSQGAKELVPNVGETSGREVVADDERSARGKGESTSSMLEQAARLQNGGKTAGAMKLFEAILSKEPNNLEALCGLGDAYLDQGAYGRAIANYRRALRSNSTFGPALLGLAGAFKALTQNEQALKYYEQYLQKNPNGREAALARRNMQQLRDQQAKGDSQTENPQGEAGKSPGQSKKEESGETPGASQADQQKEAVGAGAEESEE